MIWDGVFRNFLEIPGSRTSNHAPAEWIDKSIERADLINSVMPDRWLECFSANPSSLLFPISSLLSEKRPIVVTEVGGNLGQLWVFLRQWISPTEIQWQIVERPELLGHSEAKKHLSSEITWFGSLDEVPTNSAILYFGSSFQYVDDLEADIMPFLQRAQPSWIVIADGMVGKDIPTFCTWQNYFDNGFPAKFWNFSELCERFLNIGYHLRLASPSLSIYNRNYYPAEGLPPSHQIDFPMDLIFCREDAP